MWIVGVRFLSCRLRPITVIPQVASRGFPRQQTCRWTSGVQDAQTAVGGHKPSAWHPRYQMQGSRGQPSIRTTAVARCRDFPLRIGSKVRGKPNWPRQGQQQTRMPESFLGPQSPVGIRQRLPRAIDRGFATSSRLNLNVCLMIASRISKQIGKSSSV